MRSGQAASPVQIRAMHLRLLSPEVGPTLFIGRCLAWFADDVALAAPDPGGSGTRIDVWLGGPMTVSHATGPPPACGRDLVRPGLPPGGDAEAGQGISPLSVGRSRQGLAVTGEIDESSFCFFAAALFALAEGMSLVHIDLAGVEYCDVAGLRLMVRLTQADDLNGDQKGARSVVLHAAAPHLTAVLGVLGWDHTPGLTLV